ncbi:unnamed protein product [Candidula unifasciata]|uniref:GH18 domain-containing protein n=1 Tax=Candidula unifasciata TaxID=100452 RepID=A0A8S3ZU70_9EUPU|nr:unnamed protein product [Candidula unifasciata]
MKLLLPSLLLCLLSGPLCAEHATDDCPCLNKRDCDPPVKDLGHRKEVFAFSDGSTDVEAWTWESITSLIVPSSFNISSKEEANTMCITHNKGRKFGITVEMDFSGHVNHTSEKAVEWVQFVAQQQKQWHAEIIAVNLVPYFSQDANSFWHDHVALIKMLVAMKAKIAKVTDIIKVACIVSWKPPCAEKDNSCDFTELSTDVCDFYILNPDSFTDLDEEKCRARPNIPLTKLLYGLSEYNSHHVPNNRVILGVSWHGYDYTCQSLIGNVCSMLEDNSTKCDFSMRRKLTAGEIIQENVTEFYSHQFDMLYTAPFFNYYNSTDHHHHQVWFEDSTSLTLKYNLVAELQLRGLALLYGDDLGLTSDYSDTEKALWTWPGHTVLLTDSPKSQPDVFHYADIVSGTAVGCLLLGAALGVMFVCVGLRKRIKKVNEPFVRDRQADVQDYTDDDFNL